MNPKNNKEGKEVFSESTETTAEVVDEIPGKVEEIKEEKVPQTPPKEEEKAKPKEENTPAPPKEEIKATIIIQNKNYAHFLRKTILSCIIQDFPKDQYEIIGYDANSTDLSMKVYEDFKDRIKIVKVGDKWQPAALNEILKNHAKGEFISIINSDDWLMPHFLRKHIEGFKQAPDNVVMAYSNAVQEGEDGSRRVYEPKDKEGKLVPKKEIFKRNFVFQPSVMIRRSALDKIGLFDEKLKHAWDYKAWIELAKIGSWAYIDSITTVYRLHAQMGSITQREGVIQDLIKINPDKEFLKKNLKLTDKDVERYFNEKRT